MITKHIFIVDMYIWFKFNRSWNYWKTSKLVLTAKVITESLVISGSSNADFRSYFNSGHCGLCYTKLPWQPFSCHSEIKPVLCGSEKASFPCPIINWDQLLLKGYDKRQKSFFLTNMLVNLGFYSADVIQNVSRICCLLAGILCLWI